MAEGHNWYDEIKLEELTEPYKDLATIIGLKNAIKVAEKYQGTALYLPKLDPLLRKIRDDKIRSEFNGGNYKELAIKYNLTEVWVRQIVDEKIDSNQLTLFESTK